MPAVTGIAALYAARRKVLGIPSDDPVLSFHLFASGPSTIDCDTVIADFVEITAPGYASVALNEANWTLSDSSCTVTGTYPQFTISFTGPGSPVQTVYGYWVQDDTTADFWWGDYLASPYLIPAGSSAINVVLTSEGQECST